MSSQHLSERKRLSLLEQFEDRKTELTADHMNAIVEELMDLRRRLAQLEVPELFESETHGGG